MFPLGYVRKRCIIKTVLILVPFLIFLNLITRRTSSPTHNIASPFHDFTMTVENTSNMQPQHGQSSSQKCDIPIKNKKGSLARRFPHIIIIGFGKAGTRALYQMIRMHPDVVGPSQEMRFFSDDIKYQRGVHAYTMLMPATTQAQRTIEKSPDYITKPGTAERLKKAIDHCHRNDDIKFIVVLREPFNRAVSEYLHWKLYLQRHKGERLSDFEKLAINKSGEVNNFLAQVKLLQKFGVFSVFSCRFLSVSNHRFLN